MIDSPQENCLPGMKVCIVGALGKLGRYVVR